MRKFIKEIIPKSFYVFLLILFIFFYVSKKPTTLYAYVIPHEVTISEEEYRDLIRVLMFYKDICKNEITDENIKEKWIGPKNTELFSNAFTDKDVFLELRSKNILNRRNMQEITEMMVKALTFYDGKKMCTMSFNYKGYDFTFPYKPDEKLKYYE